MLGRREDAAVIAAIMLLWVSAAADRKAVPELDRVTYAVEGVESSHGSNPLMWRRDLAGPQGPMQVSEKAAIDVGGGNRFDVAQNHAIGRAYLALLYRRYGNWPEAISAYNWGLGHLDSWIRAGRSPEKLIKGVSAYLGRVLRDSGICEPGPEAACATPATKPPRGSRALYRTLAKAEVLAAQFGADQLRLDGSRGQVRSAPDFQAGVSDRRDLLSQHRGLAESLAAARRRAPNPEKPLLPDLP